MRNLVFVVLLILLCFLYSVNCLTIEKFVIKNIEILETSSEKVGIVNIKFNILYTGCYYLSNVKIKLEIDEGEIISENPVRIELLNPNQIISISYLVNTTVNKDHIFNIYITWDKTYTIGDKGFVEVPEKSKTIHIQSVKHISGEPKINVKITPRSFRKNSIQDVEIQFCNNGSATAYNVNIKIDVSTPVISIENTSITFNRLDVHKCKYVHLRLSISSENFVILKLQYHYITSDNKFINEFKTLKLPVFGYTDVRVIPVTLYLSCSKINVLALRIENIGNNFVKDVRFSILSLENAILLNKSTTYILEILKPNEYRVLKLSVLIPREIVGDVVITYRLSYVLPGNVMITTVDSMKIPILRKPILEIIDIALPKEVKYGSIIPISLTIVNTGTSSAYNVNATLIIEKGGYLISDKSIFYTSIKPEDTVVASYTVNITGKDVLKFRILLTYEDQYGFKYRISKELIQKITIETRSLETMHRSTFMSRNTLMISIVTVICIGFIVMTIIYIIRRKKKV